MFTNGLRVVGERAELGKTFRLLVSLTIQMCSPAAEKNRVGQNIINLVSKLWSWRSLEHVCI